METIREKLQRYKGSIEEFEGENPVIRYRHADEYCGAFKSELSGAIAIVEEAVRLLERTHNQISGRYAAPPNDPHLEEDIAGFLAGFLSK